MSKNITTYENFTQLRKEFHPTKNGNQQLKNFAYHSHKKFWWRCRLGHEWETIIKERTRGRNCPYCSGRRVSAENNLKVLFPRLVEEWHPTKNGKFQPEHFTKASGRKVWWVCKKGHEWKTMIPNRTIQKQGCPYCAGRRVSADNNLKVLFPKLAKEWHLTKNGNDKPEHFTKGSNRNVWWICKKKHEWEATIHNRTSQKQGCPYCSGKRVSAENNLKVLFPILVEEWHLTKNGNDKPEHFTKGSHKKIWWQCKNGHEWFATIKDRTIKESKCPNCTGQSSRSEIRILTELMSIFPNVKSRFKMTGFEIDIFIEEINVGIEYDSFYYHKKNKQNELKKNIKLKSQGINLLRVRQSPLLKISDNDVLVFGDNIKKDDLNSILKSISLFCNKNYKLKIKKYITRKNFVNEKLYKYYLSYFPSPLPENSLFFTHSKLIKEWNYSNNFPLRPENFYPKSNQKVWWICKKGHEWEARIAKRTEGRGCPYCANQKVGQNNNLKVLFPKLSKEWHPTKNEKSKPEHFTKGSTKKVWWLCKKNHEWQATPNSRTNQKSGCPFCYKDTKSKN